MPNVNSKLGLISTGRTAYGSFPSQRQYKHPASDAVAISINDACYMVGGITIKSGRSGTVPFIGVAQTPVLASTLGFVQVIDDPFAEFYSQDNASSTGLVEADMSLNIQLDVSGTPVNQLSAHQLDYANKGTGTLDMRMDGLQGSPGNDYGVNADVIVYFNRHFRLAGRTGV